jgi:hypothetical protein
MKDPDVLFCKTPLISVFVPGETLYISIVSPPYHSGAVGVTTDTTGVGIGIGSGSFGGDVTCGLSPQLTNKEIRANDMLTPIKEVFSFIKNYF